MKELYEYQNDFLFFIVRPAPMRDDGSLLYCSGVDLYRFLPITKGRHRPMSNPAMRGLQLVNLGVRALALSSGATPKSLWDNKCAGLVPVREGLYKERLLIEKAPESFPEELIKYCVINIMKKISNASLLGETMPETVLEPDKLQEYIEELCRKYEL